MLQLNLWNAFQGLHWPESVACSVLEVDPAQLVHLQDVPGSDQENSRWDCTFKCGSISINDVLPHSVSPIIPHYIRLSFSIWSWSIICRYALLYNSVKYTASVSSCHGHMKASRSNQPEESIPLPPDVPQDLLAGCLLVREPRMETSS